MKAGETQLIAFLRKQAQFIIPIYQRTYSWTAKQCLQLWNDIIRTGKDDKIPGHFIGSIVYIEKGLYSLSTVPQLLVIDGQQRLTTLALLLSALGTHLDLADNQSTDEITGKKIKNYFLFNSEEEGDLHYKLLLTQSDCQTLNRLLDGKEQLEPSSPSILDNYKLFLKLISESDLDPQVIYKGIAKLIVVDIALDRNYDNPQLIFESLNSTGLELSQADLIRNYILMGQESAEQQNLYNDFWHPMEQGFGKADYSKIFDRFMRDYLTVKTGEIPVINQVYEYFKKYSAGTDTGSIREIVQDIFTYSKYFVSVYMGKEPDPVLNDCFMDINTLKVDVAYPLILSLYPEYEKGELTRDQFVEILRAIESYVFRRSVCGIPTNSLNNTFAALIREIDSANRIESFKAALLLKDSYRRFPADTEFLEAFVRKDMYNVRIKKYWLSRLENYNRKEMINVDDYTIEHILPQNPNLSDAWRKELGTDWQRVQDSYLHTIGNLTLTGYNPELSDRPFIEKRNMTGGFADSPIRLNRDLANLNNWNEEEIKSRADALSRFALEVWKYPALPQEVLDNYRPKAPEPSVEPIYTYADHPHLIGSVMSLFRELRQRVLALDPCVEERIVKSYIAFRISTNFVYVHPQKNRLMIDIWCGTGESMDDGALRSLNGTLISSDDGYAGLAMSSADQLDEVMVVVRQAFESQMEYGDV